MFGGEKGIRTLDTVLGYTRFPVVRLRPTRPSLHGLLYFFELPITGTVDLSTYDTLYRTYLGFIESIPFRYLDGEIYPYPGIPLRIGSESEVVRLLQEYLNYISQFFGQIPSVSPTGYFGERTEEAVIAFQRLNGINPSGTVASETWNAITSLYEDLFLGNRLNEGQYPGYNVGR